jgi:hypothetical protein
VTSSKPGRHECGGFAEAQPRTKEKRSREQKPPLSGRGEKPVSDDSRRWNEAQWKSQTVERFTGGTGMERRGDGLNWRSQAPKPADVSLQNLEAQARRYENRSRRILRRLFGARGQGADEISVCCLQGGELQEAALVALKAVGTSHAVDRRVTTYSPPVVGVHSCRTPSG